MQKNLEQKITKMNKASENINDDGAKLARLTSIISKEVSINSEKLTNLAKATRQILRMQQTNSNNIVSLLNAQNFQSLSFKILEEAEFVYDTIIDAVKLSSNYYPSPRLLTPFMLTRIINNITSSHKTLQPIFSAENATLYYSLKCCRTTSNEEGHVSMNISIPLSNLNALRATQVLDSNTKRKSNIDLSEFSLSLGTSDSHSFLTYLDLKNCFKITRTIQACTKRDIRISNKKFLEVLIYDITPDKILFDLPANTSIFFKCPQHDGTKTTNGLAFIAELPPSCSVENEFFHIKATKKEHDSIDLQDKPVEIKFISLETISNDLNITEKILQEIIQDMERAKENMNKTNIELANLETKFTLQNIELKQHLTYITGGVGGTIVLCIGIVLIVLVCCICKILRTINTLKG